MHGRVVGAGAESVTVETAVGAVIAPGTYPEGARVLVAVRPEYIDLALAGVSGPDPASSRVNHASLVLADVVFLGSRTLLHFKAEGADRAIAEVGHAPEEGLVPGEKFAVRWPVERTLVYPLP